ncbi:MAG: thiamine phosphate synthase [Planctomycetes bacterium]|nr:thiamine phosphate synthase [Planctomycetota bacterium]
MPLSPGERERVLRVVDADRNRALEALRVVEEHARFVRGAAALAGRVQALRRDVARALAGLVTHGARDVAGDPGRPDAPSAGEQPGRGSLADLLGANLSRAKEALRVLEEYTKLLDPALVAPLVAARYALYALEPDLLAARPSLAGARVLVILGERAGRPPLAEQARACLEAGVRLLQLRVKGPDRALLEAARALVGPCEAAGALLVVNDRPDVARLAGAHGVHVGHDDLPPAEARRIVGPGALVGASAHDEAELARVVEHVDYVGFGTLFPSPTKPELGAQGLERLRALAATCPAPIYGIGGVTAETAALVVAAGAHGVAVSSAVLDAPDPAAAARRLVEALGQGPA